VGGKRYVGEDLCRMCFLTIECVLMQDAAGKRYVGEDLYPDLKVLMDANRAGSNRMCSLL
jgi:hypothetical protein